MIGNLFTKRHQAYFYHPRGGCSQPGLPQGTPEKGPHFQPVPRTLPSHQNAAQGIPKASKMRCQSVPEHPQITNKQKKWNLIKTSVFAMVYTHRSIGLSVDFHSQITKKPTLEPILSPRWSNSQKLLRNGSQEVPQIHQKSLKIDIWAPRCPNGWPRRPQDHHNSDPRVPKWSLRVPKGHPRVPKWSLNGSFGFQNHPAQ